jgi:drug/metabolite transporter, DME family
MKQNASTFGMLYCVCSAVAYTAYNVCLRDVSELYDPAWINCVQASVGMTVFGLYLAWQAFQGRQALPPWKELLALLIIGVITQLGGVLLVWGMAIVGVAVASTLQMGVMLAASAVLGLIVLGERIASRQIAAIVLITISVVLFSRGSQSASETATTSPDQNASTTAALENVDASAKAPPQETSSPLRVLLGIAAGILAGVAFAILTVGIRKTVSDHTSPEAIVFLINAMGVVVLGPWCVYQLGSHTLAQTTPQHLGVMLAAGLMNLVGFLLITKSLQRMAVVRVNIVNNAVTMALTVVAGIVWFKEPWNRDLAIGMLLAVVGTVLISLQASPEGESIVAGVPDSVS